MPEVETPNPYFIVIGHPDVMFVRSVNQMFDLCYEPQGGLCSLIDGQIAQAMVFNYDRWEGRGKPDVVKALLEMKDTPK
jgi:hypothetical protein